MKILRRDFVPEGTRSYCGNRLLSSCKAFVLQDINGSIYYAGKLCAEEHADNGTNFTDIPDLTKGLLRNNENNGRNIDETDDINHLVNNHNLGNAIAYLLLREQYLLHYTVVSQHRFTQLTNLYNQYTSNNTLTNDEVDAVLYYEKRSIQSLTLQNLANCYAYDFILRRAIIHTNNTAYFEGLLLGLRRYSKLTMAQIQGLENWFAHIPEMRGLQLRPF